MMQVGEKSLIVFDGQYTLNQDCFLACGRILERDSCTHSVVVYCLVILMDNIKMIRGPFVTLDGYRG